MGHHPLFDALLMLAWLWLGLLVWWAWLKGRSVPARTTFLPAKPMRKRAKEPKPFVGLTHKLLCEACEQAAEPQPPTSSSPPPLLTSTRGRRRTIDTECHFCPDDDCLYCGWLGCGNIRSNGHPGGKPWRQLQCVSCHGYFQETHGTPFHGKHVEPQKLVWALAALAEGVGIRAVARVFEADANTVLGWLVEAAEHLQAFSRHFLHDVYVSQVQLDELFALLSAVRDGEVTEAPAIKRLSRSPHWVWVAMDPESKLILTLDVGARTLAMAQLVVHQVAQVLAPDCAPLFVTDGFKDYMMALLTHYGRWVQPEHKRGYGPAPKPRWMPQPGLRYAQVVKSYRRRRIVRVTPRVVFSTLEAVKQVLAPRGWQMNTAFVERLNLDLRQHVAAIGRRVNTVCKHEAGLRQQLALFHTYHNFCLPHASLRAPLAAPEPTNGTGSARKWWPCTPAMAAGLTDRVWTLREVLMFRVPPWLQPQAP
jgi:IS1 family transposase/transposase-like protein